MIILRNKSFKNQYEQRDFGLLEDFLGHNEEYVKRYESYKPKNEKEIIEGVKKKASDVKSTFKTVGQRSKSIFQGKQPIPAFVKARL